MRCPDSSSFILLSGFYIDGLKVVAGMRSQTYPYKVTYLSGRNKSFLSINYGNLFLSGLTMNKASFRMCRSREVGKAEDIAGEN